MFEVRIRPSVACAFCSFCFRPSPSCAADVARRRPSSIPAWQLFGQRSRSRPAGLQAGGWLSAWRYFVLVWPAFIVALAPPAESRLQYAGAGKRHRHDAGHRSCRPRWRRSITKSNGEEVSRVEVVRDTVGSSSRRGRMIASAWSSFAGEAYLMSPLTLDHDWLAAKRRSLCMSGLRRRRHRHRFGRWPRPPTRLRDSTIAKSKIIVLLTDGSQQRGQDHTARGGRGGACARHQDLHHRRGLGSDVAKFPRRDHALARSTYTTIPVDIDEGRAAKDRRCRRREIFPRQADYGNAQALSTQEINQPRNEQGRGQAFSARHLEYFVAGRFILLGLLFPGLGNRAARTHACGGCPDEGAGNFGNARPRVLCAGLAACRLLAAHDRRRFCSSSARYRRRAQAVRTVRRVAPRSAGAHRQRLAGGTRSP